MPANELLNKGLYEIEDVAPEKEPDDELADAPDDDPDDELADDPDDDPDDELADDPDDAPDDDDDEPDDDDEEPESLWSAGTFRVLRDFA